MILNQRLPVAILCVFSLATLACTGGGETSDGEAAGSTSAPTAETETDASTEDLDHGERVEALLALVPIDARGIATVNTESFDVDQPVADPALDELIGMVGRLADEAAGTTELGDPGLDEMASALVVTPADPTAQPVLLAAAASGDVLTDGPTDDTAAGSLVPFLAALDVDADMSFVYALDGAEAEETITLADATAVSGAFDVVDGNLVGSLAFHTPQATQFVDAYNLLNRPATQGDDPAEQPLTIGQPVAPGFDQVIVPLPPYPLDAAPEDAVTSRNVLKKLFVGMEAFDYANAVGERTEPAWLDFVVKSEQFPEDPTPAGSVYIRWEFRDQAAIDEFERNELPAGFRLAPTRFLESDDPDGEIFFALNLYDAAGGTVVGGARAEWDVFVHGPDGADPNAGVRPRFAVVDVLAEEVSADATNLLTPAEPLSHQLQDGNVVSSVARLDDGGNEVAVFESSFPVPVPGEAPVARFSREMAIGNDYIYWGHGVSDRVLYNATTFNHDAHFVDISQLTFTDSSRWARYLKPEVMDAVYYQNTLEYVAWPMSNLVDSEHLDITPEWRDELIRFTTNGHQEGLMLTAVEQLFAGTGDPFVGKEVSNEIPATYYHFEVTDPTGLETALDLPPGRRLAPTTLFVDDTPRHYLTLGIYEFDNSPEGARAEFSVYTVNDSDDENDDSNAGDSSNRPPDRTIIELLTERATVDPVTIITGPSAVEHTLSGDAVTTRLGSPTITFDATISAAEPTERPLHLDWIESSDDTCYLNGICDRYYYDAETLDVPVKVPSDVTIGELSTPWDQFFDSEPTAVFFRDNFQQYAIKPWYNLDGVTDSLPTGSVDDPTHVLSGTGTLRGRGSDLVDSEYSYSGDARLDGDVLVFALDQRIDNALGTAHISTTGSFDLTSGAGTQTVISCDGDGLLCAGIESGATDPYTAQELDASDLDAISWQINAAVDLGGTFGVADSASTIVASVATGG